MLMHDTDPVTVIRDLGQHVSNVHADQHLYFFINYNVKHANAHGHARSCFVYFRNFSITIFSLALAHHIKWGNPVNLYKYLTEILRRQKHCTKCFYLLLAHLSSSRSAYAIACCPSSVLSPSAFHIFSNSS